MPKKSTLNIMAFLVFFFSFGYRFLLLQVDNFPPGADIGLHNSLLHSMIGEEGRLFWNYYHMGGGISLTHPGYHFFLAFISFITGIPDHLIYSLTASLFSSLIVLCGYLIVRISWGEPVSIVTAFLMAISRVDIEMLCWGGYPNIVGLTLIPLVFYTLFKSRDSSSHVFLGVSSLFIGSILLTHSLSALTFGSIIGGYILFISVMSILGKLKKDKMHYLGFKAVFLGILIVSPFLLKIFPLYLQSGRGTLLREEYKLASLAYKSVPIFVVLISLIPVLGFLSFSKKREGSFLSDKSVLFILWILIPNLLAQSWIVGAYLDYQRFLYFVILPVIVFLALTIDWVCKFLSRFVEDVFSTGKREIHAPKVYAVSVSIILLISVSGLLPLFASPLQSVEIADFYQVVRPPENDEINWIKHRTFEESVLVSKHFYGWCLSGFAQRITLSAVDPQFIILPREFDVAETARAMLDTDFMIDNGLIQVREDGGYIGRHNPIFLINREKTPYPCAVFHFNDSEVTLLGRRNGESKMMDVTDIPVRDMEVSENSESVSLSITRKNNYLIFERKITVFRGTRFLEYSMAVETTSSGSSVDWIRLILHLGGKIIPAQDYVAVWDVNRKVCGQIIWEGQHPEVKVYTSENPSCIELLYTIEKNHKAEIKFLVGGLEVKNEEKIQRLLSRTFRHPLIKVAESEINIFDYRQAIRKREISFVTCKDLPMTPRYANDPQFNLVFSNGHVSIMGIGS